MQRPNQPQDKRCDNLPAKQIVVNDNTQGLKYLFFNTAQQFHNSDLGCEASLPEVTAGNEENFCAFFLSEMFYSFMWDIG